MNGATSAANVRPCANEKFGPDPASIAGVPSGPMKSPQPGAILRNPDWFWRKHDNGASPRLKKPFVSRDAFPLPIRGGHSDYDHELPCFVPVWMTP